ncbi:MAG: 6-phosphogluconolactonase [Paracoccaceae bacterium]
MKPEIIVYPDRETQSTALAERVADDLNAALAGRGRAALAVPGGTTPGPFLRALSAHELAWDRVAVLLTDERFVPETSERSNTRLLRETLLRGRAAAARLVPLSAPGERPEDVLGGLSAGVRAVLPLDCCVLGMGADMHTASLFPGADRLAEALDPGCREVLLPMRAAGAPEPRLTLTAPVLRAARRLHLLIAGQEKIRALERAMAGDDPTEAPVRAVMDAPARLIVHYAD